MLKEESIWGVVFTNNGLEELGEEIQPYLSEESHGRYILCKEVDMSQPYLRVLIDYQYSDGSPFEIEMYIPHRYIKLVAVGTEEKLKKAIGFISNNK